jgi:DNA-binding MarR family transcriptional regulator
MVRWISKEEGSPYHLFVTKLTKDIIAPATEAIHPEAAVAPGYLANHVARVFNRLVDARLREHGLTLSLIGPLLLLSWKGPMLQRDLVRHSAVKQPAMVALLDKLEAAGMITRLASAQDKRAATVDLTDRGRDAATLGRAVLLEMNAKAVSGFAPQETAMVVNLLGRVIANLEGEAGTQYHA